MTEKQRSKCTCKKDFIFKTMKRKSLRRFKIAEILEGDIMTKTNKI